MTAVEQTQPDPRGLSAEDLHGISSRHVKRPLTAAIREKCLDCCCGLVNEVRHCPVTDCALWPFRMNSNPFHRNPLAKGSPARNFTK